MKPFCLTLLAATSIAAGTLLASPAVLAKDPASQGQDDNTGNDKAGQNKDRRKGGRPQAGGGGQPQGGPPQGSRVQGGKQMQGDRGSPRGAPRDTSAGGGSKAGGGNATGGGGIPGRGTRNANTPGVQKPVDNRKAVETQGRTPPGTKAINKPVTTDSQRPGIFSKKKLQADDASTKPQNPRKTQHGQQPGGDGKSAGTRNDGDRRGHAPRLGEKGSNPVINAPAANKPVVPPVTGGRTFDRKGGAPGLAPVQAAPTNGRPPQSADRGGRGRMDDIKRGRKETKIDGGKNIVIREPDNRTIIKQNNKLIIQHDDAARIRRVAPNARFERGKSGSTIAVVDRPGGVKIYSESDANGQLIRRYRRDANGRDTVIIDNRGRGRGKRRNHIGKDIAIGAGIGIGIAAGAAILNSVVDVPPPRVRIPRDKYIVEYDDASEDDVYEALSAPPVDDINDHYTLDQIRATPGLRERMRRVDLDDITFETGSWEVDPSQYRKLDRIARAMSRVVSRNPNEVFMIEGYTDAVGSREDNLSLSDRRAESVAEVLSEQFQVPFENLTTQGYGEDYLKVDTDGPERLNRRVAVRRITPLLSSNSAAPPRDGEPDSGPGPDDDEGPDQGSPDDDGPPGRD